MLCVCVVCVCVLCVFGMGVCVCGVGVFVCAKVGCVAGNNAARAQCIFTCYAVVAEWA